MNNEAICIDITKFCILILHDHSKIQTFIIWSNIEKRSDHVRAYDTMKVPIWTWLTLYFIKVHQNKMLILQAWRVWYFFLKTQWLHGLIQWTIRMVINFQNWAQSVSHNKTFASYYEGLMIFHVHKSVCSWLLPKLRLYQKHNFRYKKQVFFSLEQYLKYLKVNVAVSYHIEEKKSREYEEYILFVSLFLYFANGYYCLT